jgi:signal transduction histidine kinase
MRRIMLRNQIARLPIRPVTVWLVLLAVIFATEYTVMFLLPWLLPQRPSRLAESAADAVVLTLVLAPVLWWTLVRPLREAVRLRTEFLSELFAQIEADRRRTATELHDGVGQVLALLISGLRSAKPCRVAPDCASRVDGFQALAEKAMVEVRQLAMGLRPSVLDDFGLAPALERLVEDVRSHHPVAVQLNVADVAARAPADEAATAVFRIIQEALANIVKHAKARHADVSVHWSKGDLVVQVRDDGCGLENPDAAAMRPGRLGLRGMRERAALLGGAFDIESAPGKGTRLTITIPGEAGA